MLNNSSYYKSLFENYIEPLFILTKDRFIDCNEAALRELHYSKEELLNLHPSQISPLFQPDGKSSKKKADEMIKIAIENGNHRFFWIHKDKNGNEIPYEVLLTVLERNKDNVVIHATLHNKSEEYAAKKRLKKTELNYSMLIDFAPNAFFHGSNKGLIIDLNRQAEKLTGYSKEELLGKKLDILFSEDVLKEKPIRYDLVQSGQNVTIKRTITHKSGKKVPVMMHSNKMPDNTLFSIIVDMSQIDEYEKEIKIKEETYRGILDKLDEAIYILKEDLTFIDVNKGVERMYGYDKNEIIGKTPAFLSAEKLNDHLDLISMSEKTFKGEVQEFEFWGKKKNGFIFPKLVKMYPGTYMGEKVIIALAIDITHLYESEKNLKESEELFRNLTQTTSTAIFIFQDEYFVFVNNATLNILGYSKDEMHKMKFWDVVHDDYKEIVKARGLQRQKGSEVPTRYEFKVVKKNGEVAWVDFTAGKIMWNGKPAGIGTAFDITARKKTEELLKLSQERYKIISDLTTDYIFSSEINGKVFNTEWVAGSFKEITGYNFEEFKKNGDWKSLLFPKDIEKDQIYFDKLLNNEKLDGELRIVHKNGNVIWIRILAQPIFDKKKNKVTKIVGAIKDITKEKQIKLIQQIQHNIARSVIACKTIRELFPYIKEELQKLFNTKNFLIAHYNKETGMFRSDIFEDENDKFVTWSSNRTLTGLVVKARETKLFYREDIYQLEKNNEIDILGTVPEIWLGVPLQTINEVFGVLVIQDYEYKNAFNKEHIELLEIVANQISLFIERKNSDEDRQRLSKAIIQSPVGVVITDVEGKVKYVNPAYEKISGYSKEDLINENLRILKSGFHENKYYKDIWDTLLSGKDWRGEIKNRKKNGELFWEDAIITPITNEYGEITNFVAIKEDITEKKLMLEELIEAKNKAESSEKIKTEFLAQMSHEIRSPINVIMNFIGLIKDELEQYANEDVKYGFNSIDAASRRIIRTIDLILNMSDIQLGTYKPIFKKINLKNDILEKIYSEFKYLAQSKGIILNLVDNSKNCILNFDEYSIYQIFANLVDNAIKYTDDGTIDIIIMQNAKLEVIIKDTGIGIAEDVLPTIFEPFTQEDTGYTRKYEGNGLGLALVKKYCELNNAEISVRSKKGEGTEFIVRF